MWSSKSDSYTVKNKKDFDPFGLNPPSQHNQNKSNVAKMQMEKEKVERDENFMRADGEEYRGA